MKKALIVYARENEKAKFANEEKTAIELEKQFENKGFTVQKILLKAEKKLDIKKQLRNEKEIIFTAKMPRINSYEYVVVGTPIVGSITSTPLINAFIRSLPKDNLKKTKIILYATGIIPGFAIKKMQSLFSMHGITVFDFEVFTSIFEFDEKKLNEVRKFFERFIEKSTK